MERRRRPAPLRRVARAVSGIDRVDGFAWYHPRRLSLDAGAVAGGVANPAQRILGVRATHRVKLPVYAYETSLGRAACWPPPARSRAAATSAAWRS